MNKTQKILLIGGMWAVAVLTIAAPNLIYQKSILPLTNGTYDIGSTTPAAEWKNVYTQNLTVSGTCTGCGTAAGDGPSHWATSTITTAINTAGASAIGVGSTSPAFTLSIQGNGLISGDLIVANLTATGTLLTTGSSTIVGPLTVGGSLNASSTLLSTGNTYLAINSGFVGIGTTSPATFLHIKSASTTSNNTLILETGIDQSSEYNAIDFRVTAGDSYGAIRNYISASGEGSMSFHGRTSGVMTEVMRFEGSGDMFVGITDGVGKLNIARGGGSGGVAPTTLTAANNYLTLGSAEYNNSSYRIIGFGYQPVGNTNSPAYIGYQEMASVSGQTKGDLIFGTRDVTTDTQASERMRIMDSGEIGIGTSSPSQLLSVHGNALISGDITSVSSITATGTLTVTPLTSALVLTGAGGAFAEYAGTSCTNQFPRSLSALGAATCASVDLVNDITGTLGVASGGTGKTSFVSGDLIYAQSPTTLTTLASSTGGTILSLSGAGIPIWIATSTFLTNPMTLAGDMIYGGNLGAPLRLASSTGGYVLSLTGAGNPSWVASTTYGSGLSYATTTNQVTNAGVLSVSCTTITCSGTNPASFSIGSNAIALSQIAQIAANSVVGNNTSGTANLTAFATSTLFGTGTGGFLLGWNNGVPQWVASTTYGSGLTYATSTNQVTNTGVLTVSCSGSLSCSGTNPASFTYTQGTVTVAQGGTNATSFGNSMLLETNNGTTIKSTSTPTVGFINATSTTATSTFLGNISIGNNASTSRLKVDVLTDLASSMVINRVYKTFTIATTTWTGTTTLLLGTSFVKETWNKAICRTDIGTLTVLPYNSTVFMTQILASTASSTSAITTNNALSALTNRKIDVGTPASLPTRLTCTIDITENL